MDMFTGLLLALSIFILLIVFAILVKLFRKSGRCKCTRDEPMTLLTPVTLSMYEINDLSLEDIIKEHAPSAAYVVIDGEVGVEITIQDYLNVLTQKVRQHDLEIAELAIAHNAKATKPKRKPAKRKPARK